MESWGWMAKPHTGTVAYPESGYIAPDMPDLSKSEERRRLSPAALKALFQIIVHWKVRDEDARELLGGISNGAYYQYKKNPRKKPLEQDKLLRVSYLVGIF